MRFSKGPGRSKYALAFKGDVSPGITLGACGQDIAGESAFSLGMIAEFEPSLRKHGAWSYRRLFWETGLVGQVLYLEAEAAGVRATGIGCLFDDPVHQVLGFKDAAFSRSITSPPEAPSTTRA